ncbi:MAG TPA: cytidylate kinase [Cyanobacteria bacterium UBA9226]|nr:cytidylate kinase [Cyanobacteria bacterium UBA9226]
MTYDPISTMVVPPESITSVLCGRFRPGHFQGVATIVTKLLNLVQPNRAYFGQKDAQQLAIVRRLVADLNIPVEIVACPTVREASGLAFSSRNQYLTEAQKAQASILYRSLQEGAKVFQAGDCDRAVIIEAVRSKLAEVSDIEVEYIELVDPQSLKSIAKIEASGLLAIAARLGTTRLIDNMVLQKRRPIVAIDGPAGAGKSTVTRRVAQELGLMYLDTGAMYRAITWQVMSAGIKIDDEPAIAQLVSQSEISLTQSDEGLQVWINGEEVTQEIRSLEVTANVSAIAAIPAVRLALVKQQQRWGAKGGIVAEGRDIGTFVFPDAELKIFLTASVEERARRRFLEIKEREESDVTLAQLEEDIHQRDLRDSTRAIAPLRKAEDAIEINTDGMNISEVTQYIINLYRQNLEGRG